MNLTLLEKKPVNQNIKEKNCMKYTQIIDSCFEDIVGGNGLTREEFAPVLKKAQRILDEVKQQKAENTYPLLNLLENDDDLAEIIRIAESIADEFDELVVLGTGGSTLNPQTLVALAQPHDGIDKKVYFIDSVDPYTVAAFIEQLDLPSTAFLITSKSGRTVETLAQFLTFISALDDAMIADKGRHLFIISDPFDNPLRRVGKQVGATILDHQSNIGGRFSTFTNVGLIPAIFAGVDVKAFREGAREAMELFLNSENSEPVVGAALSVAFMQKNINISVMMPYVDRLSSFATWYRQIWAESLGKEGKGSTPIKAVGALDQHSQLQIYLDGPKDKFFNLITLNTRGKGKKIDPEFTEDLELEYLTGKTVGDINAALQQATEQTLIKNGCPLRHIKLQALDERVLGALMTHFMLETIITAGLLDLNAFDQPAVEAGKVLAREILKG
jgi:glucose-6-phosphate isomerase